MINKDNFIDMAGMKFGYWTVLYRVNNTCYVQAVWHCRCDCGTEKDVNRERARCIGNGWTVGVIVHIFNCMKQCK